ncbi:hypothetical protein ACQVP2_05830 [Methylobacterium aquaticum]|uniref:hypothetical protein n=1 Tax=Methylobacterium aquaticum TaxID=270351 RepID=UPI0018CF60F6|nr:hypothetical protein [Methylobacterium aquaticum]
MTGIVRVLTQLAPVFKSSGRNHLAFDRRSTDLSMHATGAQLARVPLKSRKAALILARDDSRTKMGSER